MINKKFYLFALLSYLCLNSCNQEADHQNCSSDYTSTTNSDLQDNINEIEKSFVDLDKLKLLVSKDSILISIGVLKLPKNLIFNHNELSVGKLNYDWSISFDVDKNCSISGDIQISLSHYKVPGSKQLDGFILNHTQATIWKLTNKTTASAIIDISQFVTTDSNAIILSIPKYLSEELNDITSKTSFFFSTSYDDGVIAVKDYFPN